VVEVKKLLASLIYSLNGLKKAYQRDKSFRMEVWSAVLWILFGFFAWPLSRTEFLFLSGSYSLILITELINTAFEAALERLHPERHELISATKDIASAAVFMAIIFAIIVAGVIATSRLGGFA